MKINSLLCIAFLLLGFSLIAQVNPSSTYVNGYYRQDGTYVSGYYRTTPNTTINDNYSTYPNTNPYTGAQGTVQPEYNYQIPPAYNLNTYYNSVPKTPEPLFYTPSTYSYPTYQGTYYQPR